MFRQPLPFTSCSFCLPIIPATTATQPIAPMPATFESFGLRFLYPDNWTIVERAEDEGADGVTFELPTGGFFSIEQVRDGQLEEELIEEVADSIDEEYGEVEREEVASERWNADGRFPILLLGLAGRFPAQDRSDRISDLLSFRCRPRAATLKKTRWSLQRF